MRRRRVAAAVAATAVVAGGTVLGVRALLHSDPDPVPGCRVGHGTAALRLSFDQAEDATTIAAVGTRMRLPARAVTIALAAALQESKLHNYPFGDRDSLGLFQQRPSQGWGRPMQLLTPAYAAEAFYRHLARVDAWQTLPVAAAAQAVQHSADGAAYAQWEEDARSMARALTGEIAQGMACRYPTPAQARGAALAALADQELGPGVLKRTGGTLAEDWTVAEWLVGHAYGYGLVSVSVRGLRWTNDGEWHEDEHASDSPSYQLATPRS